MPKATVSTQAVRHDLETLPDGYIMVKQLSHGQKLHRADIAARLSYETAPQNRAQKRNGKARQDTPSKTDIELLQLAARQFEYTHMIVEHNLEEDNGQLFDFGDVTSFDRLAPQIGEEIDDILDSTNAGTVDKENFQQRSEHASTEEVIS